MPEMTGLDLCPRPSHCDQTCQPMITAYGDAETKRKVLEGGAEALLTKAIDFLTLRNQINVRVERAV
jgi:DNA-binding response OmpR family regulator